MVKRKKSCFFTYGNCRVGHLPDLLSCRLLHAANDGDYRSFACTFPEKNSFIFRGGVFPFLSLCTVFTISHSVWEKAYNYLNFTSPGISIFCQNLYIFFQNIFYVLPIPLLQYAKIATIVCQNLFSIFSNHFVYFIRFLLNSLSIIHTKTIFFI